MRVEGAAEPVVDHDRRHQEPEIGRVPEGVEEQRGQHQPQHARRIARAAKRHETEQRRRDEQEDELE
jgi:hypothetical protein